MPVLFRALILCKCILLNCSLVYNKIILCYNINLFLETKVRFNVEITIFAALAKMTYGKNNPGKSRKEKLSHAPTGSQGVLLDKTDFCAWLDNNLPFSWSLLHGELRIYDPLISTEKA